MNFYIINLENKRETYFEENELIIGRQLLENVNIFLKKKFGSITIFFYIFFSVMTKGFQELMQL